jgi:hypothetical protein
MKQKHKIAEMVLELGHKQIFSLPLLKKKFLQKQELIK